jgi:hypothetical protein
MRIHQEELQKHLEHAARLSALLGLKPRELAGRLREASETIAEKEKS